MLASCLESNPSRSHLQDQADKILKAAVNPFCSAKLIHVQSPTGRIPIRLLPEAVFVDVYFCGARLATILLVIHQKICKVESAKKFEGFGEFLEAMKGFTGDKVVIVLNQVDLLSAESLELVTLIPQYISCVKLVTCSQFGWAWLMRFNDEITADLQIRYPATPTEKQVKEALNRPKSSNEYTRLTDLLYTLMRPRLSSATEFTVAFEKILAKHNTGHNEEDTLINGLLNGKFADILSCQDHLLTHTRDFPQDDTPVPKMRAWVLMACALASFNPAPYDLKLFGDGALMQDSSRAPRKHTSQASGDSYVYNEDPVPHPFPLVRLSAILLMILPAECPAPTSIHIARHLGTLAAEGLLMQPASIHADRSRYRLNVPVEHLQRVAWELGFSLNTYLKHPLPAFFIPPASNLPDNVDVYL